jgi:hypothetical protein
MPLLQTRCWRLLYATRADQVTGGCSVPLLQTRWLAAALCHYCRPGDWRLLYAARAKQVTGSWSMLLLKTRCWRRLSMPPGQTRWLAASYMVPELVLWNWRLLHTAKSGNWLLILTAEAGIRWQGSEKCHWMTNEEFDGSLLSHGQIRFITNYELLNLFCEL